MSDTNEIMDILTAFAWIRSFGGTLNENMLFLNKPNDRRHGEVFRKSEHGEAFISAGANWIREQQKKAGY